MNIEYLNNRINKIKKLKNHALAHMEEDELREDFIRSLINFDYSKQEIKEFASMVLSTNLITIERWCC